MDEKIKHTFIDAGIDVDDDMHRFMDREDLFVRFMKQYPDDDSLKLLTEDIDRGDVHEAFEHAHALKGVAGNLGFKTMLESLVPVVEKLRGGSLEGSEEYIMKIRESDRKIRDAIDLL